MCVWSETISLISHEFPSSGRFFDSIGVVQHDVRSFHKMVVVVMACLCINVYRRGKDS